jgi:hypothetical protein
MRSLGGVAGNEILTSSVAAVLTVLLVIEGVTILRLGSLLVPHMVVGLMLIPVVGLKLGSTGYRFLRYYSHAPAYREKGPRCCPCGCWPRSSSPPPSASSPPASPC